MGKINFGMKYAYDISTNRMINPFMNNGNNLVISTRYHWVQKSVITQSEKVAL
jgi:hypothetical protein